MPVYALLLERTDYAFDHTVLLQTMRHDERLAQAVTTQDCGIAARSKNQAVARPIDRLRTCQLINWNTRCTVCLLNLSRCATVRYPNSLHWQR